MLIAKKDNRFTEVTSSSEQCLSELSLITLAQPRCSCRQSSPVAPAGKAAILQGWLGDQGWSWCGPAAPGPGHRWGDWPGEMCRVLCSWGTCYSSNAFPAWEHLPRIQKRKEIKTSPEEE